VEYFKQIDFTHAYTMLYQAQRSALCWCHPLGV